MLSESDTRAKLIFQQRQKMIPRIRSGYSEDAEILQPSLAEQRLMPGILNERMAAIDRARAAREAQRHEINALPQALLRKVFDGEP
jgi:hypothetical protein